MANQSLLVKKMEEIKKQQLALIEEQELTRKLNENFRITKKQKQNFEEEKGTLLGPVLPFKRSNGGTKKLKNTPYISRLK